MYLCYYILLIGLFGLLSLNSLNTKAYLYIPIFKNGHLFGIFGITRFNPLSLTRFDSILVGWFYRIKTPPK